MNPKLLATCAAVTVAASIGISARLTAPNREPESWGADRRAVLDMPGLVAMWDFADDRWQTCDGRYTATERGSVRLVPGGPFGYAAKFDGRSYLTIPHNETGALNINGPHASVSMFAVVYLDSLDKGTTIAGMWREGNGRFDDSGARQYAMLLHMPLYGGAQRLTPHISAEGGVTRCMDGTPMPWCVDYAISANPVPVGRWITLGFSYDGESIRAYVDGRLDATPGNELPAERSDPYFSSRGANPYFHGRGIFGYDAAKHATTKPQGGADFIIGARQVRGDMRREAFRGRIGMLAVFDRALSDTEFARLHEAMCLP